MCLFGLELEPNCFQPWVSVLGAERYQRSSDNFILWYFSTYMVRTWRAKFLQSWDNFQTWKSWIWASTISGVRFLENLAIFKELNIWHWAEMRWRDTTIGKQTFGRCFEHEDLISRVLRVKSLPFVLVQSFGVNEELFRKNLEILWTWLDFTSMETFWLELSWLGWLFWIKVIAVVFVLFWRLSLNYWARWNPSETSWVSAASHEDRSDTIIIVAMSVADPPVFRVERILRRLTIRTGTLAAYENSPIVPKSTHRWNSFKLVPNGFSGRPPPWWESISRRSEVGGKRCFSPCKVTTHHMI